MKIKYYFIYLLTFFSFFLSCNDKEEGKNTEKNGVVYTKDNIWFDFPKIIKVQDSVKITLHYHLNLDTLNNHNPGLIAERYTMFLYTYQNISEKEITNVIRSRNKEQFKKLGLKGTMIKDSFSFYHKFDKSGVHYITGFVEDNLSLKVKGEDNKTRKIGTYIIQKIMVKSPPPTKSGTKLL